MLSRKHLDIAAAAALEVFRGNVAKATEFLAGAGKRKAGDLDKETDDETELELWKVFLEKHTSAPKHEKGPLFETFKQFTKGPDSDSGNDKEKWNLALEAGILSPFAKLQAEFDSVRADIVTKQENAHFEDFVSHLIETHNPPGAISGTPKIIATSNDVDMQNFALQGVDLKGLVPRVAMVIILLWQLFGDPKGTTEKIDALSNDLDMFKFNVTGERAEKQPRTDPVAPSKPSDKPQTPPASQIVEQFSPDPLTSESESDTTADPTSSEEPMPSPPDLRDIIMRAVVTALGETFVNHFTRNDDDFCNAFGSIEHMYPGVRLDWMRHEVHAMNQEVRTGPAPGNVKVDDAYIKRILIEIVQSAAPTNVDVKKLLGDNANTDWALRGLGTVEMLPSAAQESAPVKKREKTAKIHKKGKKSKREKKAPKRALYSQDDGLPFALMLSEDWPGTTNVDQMKSMNIEVANETWGRWKTTARKNSTKEETPDLRLPSFKSMSSVFWHRRDRADLRQAIANVIRALDGLSDSAKVALYREITQVPSDVMPGNDGNPEDPIAKTVVDVTVKRIKRAPGHPLASELQDVQVMPLQPKPPKSSKVSVRKAKQRDDNAFIPYARLLAFLTGDIDAQIAGIKEVDPSLSNVTINSARFVSLKTKAAEDMSGDMPSFDNQRELYDRLRTADDPDNYFDAIELDLALHSLRDASMTHDAIYKAITGEERSITVNEEGPKGHPMSNAAVVAYIAKNVAGYGTSSGDLFGSDTERDDDSV